MTERKRFEYPKPFRILRIIAWVLLPLYLLRGCRHAFSWGFGGMPRLLDLVIMSFGGLFILIFITPLKRILLYFMRGSFKKKLISSIIGLVLLLALFLQISSCHQTTANAYLGWIFEHFITDPIPESVDIKGGAFFGFQDKVGYLVFKIDKKPFQEIANLYTLVPSYKIKIRDRFTWKVTNPVFYYRDVPRGDSCESTFFIWDEDSLSCYVDIIPRMTKCPEAEMTSLYSRWTEPSEKAFNEVIEELNRD